MAIQLERKIQNEILEWIKNNANDYSFWVYDRISRNTGRGYIPLKNTSHRYEIEGLTPLDLVGIYRVNGKMVWLEIKTDTGKLSKGQSKFIEHILGSNGYAMSIRSVLETQIYLEYIRKRES